MNITIPVEAPELATILGLLATIDERTARMATQEQVDAIAGNITAAVTAINAAINAAIDGIRQDIADLKQQANVDTSALEARVADVTAAAQSLSDLDTENPPTPPPA